MKTKYSKEELAWAKEIGRQVGIDDPRVVLKMRYSAMQLLLAEKGLKMVFTFPKKKKGKPRAKP
jgi:hypothetical protein